MKIEHDSSLFISDKSPENVHVIDQRLLPFERSILVIRSWEEMVEGIRNMSVRGAPLIGIASAFGLWLGAREIRKDRHFMEKLAEIADKILTARPTAVNPHYTLKECLKSVHSTMNADEAIAALLCTAIRLRQEDIETCRQIGLHGLELIRKVWERKKPEPVAILTHCNAGWLACIRYGTALSPIYHAHALGIPLHVWVDETRPRNQGSRLTAWELGQAGIPYTIVPDNAGGHLMQIGAVDMVIVGTDRIALNGDVANKIGTYLKALSAYDNQVPFYVAAPLFSIDSSLAQGIGQIVIEERDADEVMYVEGWLDNSLHRIAIAPEGSHCANFGFDVTPARLVTGLITEKGVFSPLELKSLF